MLIEWVALLDGSTCPYCEELDGQQFGEGDDIPEIPAHVNCQCTWIPVDE